MNCTSIGKDSYPHPPRPQDLGVSSTVGGLEVARGAPCERAIFNILGTFTSTDTNAHQARECCRWQPRGARWEKTASTPPSRCDFNRSGYRNRTTSPLAKTGPTSTPTVGKAYNVRGTPMLAR